jgi:hypothetical protein
MHCFATESAEDLYETMTSTLAFTDRPKLTAMQILPV